MAYNYFPTGYQPYYPAQSNNFSSYQNTGQNGLIWIQGEAAAKSYLVAPGNTVALWDSEAQVVYLKSADASGMPSMKVLDYTIRESDQPRQTEAPDYVTREELAAFEAQIKKEIKSLTPKRRKVEEDDDE